MQDDPGNTQFPVLWNKLKGDGISLNADPLI